MRATSSPASPLLPTQAAELVLDFVNTRAIDGSVERFADGAGMAAWLVEAGLMDRGVPVTDADAAVARELRHALVDVLLAHAGHGAAEAAEEHLRRSGQLHPVLPIVTAAGASLPPAQAGVSGTLGRILAAAAELAIRGTWSRVKACQNPPCQLAFYDRSRNTSASYCGPARCGAQVAMRAYRARQHEKDRETNDASP